MFEHEVVPETVHVSDVAEPLMMTVIVAVVAASAFTRRFLNVPER